MSVPDAKKETRYESRARQAQHLLGASDVEAYRLDELLALADRESRALWDELSLGYTDRAGNPVLRTEIAGLYESVEAEDVLTFAGADEAIFVLLRTLLAPGDHAVVVVPAYEALVEVARSGGADVTPVELDADSGWALDLDRIRCALRPCTRAIVVNFPHNPTGALPDTETFAELAGLAAEVGAHLVSDEVYRFLEYEPAGRLPAAADLLPRGISLGVMSKSFALAGLRVGWIATRDRATLARAADLKDYTSACNAAPSEVLSVVALRARAAVLDRSLGILRPNLALLDGFFERRGDLFDWVRPRAGSVGFPRLRSDVPVERFCADLLAEEGVLLVPGAVYGDDGNRFRIGFGRRDLGEALGRLERFAARLPAGAAA